MVQSSTSSTVCTDIHYSTWDYNLYTIIYQIQNTTWYCFKSQPFGPTRSPTLADQPTNTRLDSMKVWLGTINGLNLFQRHTMKRTMSSEPPPPVKQRALHIHLARSSQTLDLELHLFGYRLPRSVNRGYFSVQKQTDSRCLKRNWNMADRCKTDVQSSQ